ncbi:MAG: ribonuclease E inhibitor RraB [Acidobacteria bacterium]|nr:ribonuclease E inhibitor RraB [Acidobacteriota bacterium]
MGIFDKIFGSKDPGQYRSEVDLAANRAKQIEMSPQTVAALREHGITDEKTLPLEFFFYTNSEEKASKLSNELAALEYSSSYGNSAHNRKEFLINGWSTPIQIDENRILQWTADMCDRGAKHDCEFDGWGTSV